jgi:hypothetical protein
MGRQFGGGEFCVCLAACVAVLLAAQFSQAVTIRDLTTGTTLFHEDFESGTLSPSPGTSFVGPSVTVTNSTTAPDPGPAQGQFYLKFFRDSNTVSQGNYHAFPSSLQDTNGDVIRLSMMVYIPNDGIDARAQFFMDNGDFNTARAWMRPDGAGNVDAVGPGFVVTDTGLDYTPNTWQQWDLEYAIGGSTFSVTVNGVTASGFASVTSGSISKAEMLNGSTVPGSFFLDALPVPEPGSGGAVLALSLATLTWYSRRHRFA